MDILTLSTKVCVTQLTDVSQLPLGSVIYLYGVQGFRRIVQA